ncbi:MAG: SUMF1/EgtB/PvdO family nonheme iron enzyme, partial [Candidatus Omnitrophota bacterium]
LKKGSADNDPWQITGESAIAVTNAVNHGTYYVSGGNSGEDPTGAVFTIPGAFPKGYNAFYAMKYEISEEAWAEFFSTLTDDQKSSRDITATTGKNSQGVVNRNTISWSGGDAATSRPDRACSFLSWMDLCAYADWAGLRPITELEYEKMCRGSCAPVAGEYAWGNTMITAAATLPAGNENGTETVLNASANACFGNTMFSQGDGGLGPLRCGIFAAASTSRRGAGAGYYGNMELSGNLAERVVTIGNAQGRSFAGSNGDGLLTVTTGHAGNATNTDWPGIDASPVNGVTGAAGAGFRGGDWSDDAAYLRVADRSRAALASAVRADTYGGRCARNAP